MSVERTMLLVAAAIPDATTGGAKAVALDDARRLRARLEVSRMVNLSVANPAGLTSRALHLVRTHMSDPLDALGLELPPLDRVERALAIELVAPPRISPHLQALHRSNRKEMGLLRLGFVLSMFARCMAARHEAALRSLHHEELPRDSWANRLVNETAGTQPRALAPVAARDVLVRSHNMIGALEKLQEKVVESFTVDLPTLDRIQKWLQCCAEAADLCEMRESQMLKRVGDALTIDVETLAVMSESDVRTTFDGLLDQRRLDYFVTEITARRAGRPVLSALPAPFAGAHNPDGDSATAVRRRRDARLPSASHPAATNVYAAEINNVFGVVIVTTYEGTSRKRKPLTARVFELNDDGRVALSTRLGNPHGGERYFGLNNRDLLRLEQGLVHRAGRNSLRSLTALGHVDPESNYVVFDPPIDMSAKTVPEGTTCTGFRFRPPREIWDPHGVLPRSPSRSLSSPDR